MIEKIHCMPGDTKYTYKQSLMYKFISLDIFLATRIVIIEIKGTIFQNIKKRTVLKKKNKNVIHLYEYFIC